MLDLLLAEVTRYTISPFPSRCYCRTAGGGMHSGMPSTFSMFLFITLDTMMQSSVCHIIQYHISLQAVLLMILVRDEENKLCFDRMIHLGISYII